MGCGDDSIMQLISHVVAELSESMGGMFSFMLVGSQLSWDGFFSLLVSFT
jgi:hypothetical protein